MGSVGKQRNTNGDAESERTSALLFPPVEVRTPSNRADLDDAVSAKRKTLYNAHTSYHHQAVMLHALANALVTRFSQTGDGSDLEIAILIFRKALEFIAYHPSRSGVLTHLATALQTRFQDTGRRRRADLDEAISLHCEALALCTRSHPDRSMSLTNLAGALQARFGVTGRRVDLDEAIRLLREALVLCAGSHPYRSSSLSNLATALHTRFEQTSHHVDLDEAVTLYREALALRPGSHPDRLASLNRLANTLSTRFAKTDQLASLDEAVTLRREALVLCSTSHPDQSSVLTDLAGAVYIRFQQTHQLVDLNEVIELHQQALELIPTQHPHYCQISIHLGMAFLERCRQNGSQLEKATKEPLPDSEKFRDSSEDVHRATEALRTAAYCESAVASDRFEAARHWARTLEISDNRDGSILDAYQTAIDLLPRLTMFGLDSESRQRVVMSDIDGLARDAAACAIKWRQYNKAIEFLEAGRTIFWSQALQLRTPLDRLHSVEPKLAQKLKGISQALERGAFRDVSRAMSDPREKVMAMEKEASRFCQMNNEWLETIKSVREIDGFQDFLCTKSFTTLSDAAYNGPIVILNASKSKSRCDALVMKSSHEPVHVPLPKVTQEMLSGLVIKLHNLSGTSIPEDRGVRAMMRVGPYRKSPDAIIQDVLRTLWTSVVRPVLRFMKLEKSDSPPRLWWLPTGPFASLPIHAAGIYDAHHCECVSDYVISSYTPTLHTLLTPPPAAAEPFEMLAVIQPATREQRSLPYTRVELRKIEEHVPDECLIKFGTPDAPAYVDKVLSEFPSSSIVHLACHGVQDTKNPLDSALLLEDGPLTISRLMPLSMPNASLVFLSACQTAPVDNKLPDEVIHLAATLLFAGFRGAVATMWSIQDIDGPTIADSFYRHLFSTSKSGSPPDMTRAAEALHLAVAELRNKLHAEKFASRFVRWVPFIHMGL